MLSPCCSEKIRVEFHEEYYHCCDDGYPLKVPYLVCTKCGKGLRPPIYGGGTEGVDGREESRSDGIVKAG